MSSCLQARNRVFVDGIEPNFVAKFLGISKKKVPDFFETRL